MAIEFFILLCNAILIPNMELDIGDLIRKALGYDSLAALQESCYILISCAHTHTFLGIAQYLMISTY